ncbi:MAG: hypothetical protein ACLUR5_02420 [Eubacterium ventriosum]
MKRLSYVQELAGEDANIIFGVRYEDTYPDECSITVMATGIGEPATEKTSFSTKMKTNPFASTVAKPKTSTTPMTDYTRNVATAPHGTA